MHASYQFRRELMYNGLKDIPGLTVSSPEGAFYLFPKYDADLPAAEMVAAPARPRRGSPPRQRVRPQR